MQRAQKPLGRPPKAQQKQSTKEMIQQIATDMFLKKGYPSVSMDDVAQACDVTKATVYYYYSTKADLFTDAIVQLMKRITKGIVEILSLEKPLKERLFLLAKMHLQATVDININALMKESKIALSSEQQEIMEKTEEEMYTVLEDAFSTAINKGDIPQKNAYLAAQLFISMLSVGNNMDLSRNDTSLDDVVTQMVDLFWDGLAHE